MKQHATITVIGRDKTGVIARVTGFLFEQHANIEALEEQVTRGQFSRPCRRRGRKMNFTLPVCAPGWSAWPARSAWKSNCAPPNRAGDSASPFLSPRSRNVL